jgi:hypothetical protein
MASFGESFNKFNEDALKVSAAILQPITLEFSCDKTFQAAGGMCGERWDIQVEVHFYLKCNGKPGDKFSFIHIQKTKRKTLSTTKPSTTHPHQKTHKKLPKYKHKKSQIITKNKSRRIAQR